jgi:hypothetical protein
MVRRAPHRQSSYGRRAGDSGDAVTGAIPPPDATADLVAASGGDQVSLLSWLHTVADQNVPAALGPAKVPVAWVGRTSTEDNQDPTLSLPRQLDGSRHALPDEFVIVAHFYDVESGRTAEQLRGRGHGHEHFDIPIPRDGGIADLLVEAKQPNRRFVAVICESIERVDRTMYGSLRLEHELEQAGIALLAADEPFDRRSIPALAEDIGPAKRATPTLTRRIKQAIAEWYGNNMLELVWGGFKVHTNQDSTSANRPTATRPGRSATRSRPRPCKAGTSTNSCPTRSVARSSPRSSPGGPWNGCPTRRSPTGSTPTSTGTRHPTPSPAAVGDASVPGPMAPSARSSTTPPDVGRHQTRPHLLHLQEE